MFPLSFAQRRLWFLDGLEGPSATYNVPNAFRLSGPLRVDALRCAFVDVIGRHESLRTVFQEMEGEPRQVVLPVDAVSGGLRVEEVGRDGLDEFLAREAAVPFLLSSDLPIRGVLVRLGELEHVLLVVVHHIAADGWSLGPLMRDLAFAYGARCRGEEPSWAPLPVQYVDYTLWQRELLGSPEDPDSVLRRQLDYWREQLGGLPAVLDLPTDRPRPAIASHQGGQVPFRCSPELYAGLRALARESQATLFMVLQAGLAALLTRMGAGEDVPIGSPIAGRGDAALDDLVGFFVNTLVLRTDTSGDPTFRELLARVRATDLAAYANQDVPFERVVEALNPTRSRSWQPLFQVLLTFQNSAEGMVWSLGGAESTHKPVSEMVAKFDLAFIMREVSGSTDQCEEIVGRLEYAQDLFDQETAEALSARLVRVLESVVGNPDALIGDIDIVLEPERDLVLQGWNSIDAALPGITV